MDKAMGPLRDLRTPYWLSGFRTDVPAEPPSQRPCLRFYLGVLRLSPNPKCFGVGTFRSCIYLIKTRGDDSESKGQTRWYDVIKPNRGGW